MGDQSMEQDPTHRAARTDCCSAAEIAPQSKETIIISDSARDMHRETLDRHERALASLYRVNRRMHGDVDNVAGEVQRRIHAVANEVFAQLSQVRVRVDKLKDTVEQRQRLLTHQARLLDQHGIRLRSSTDDLTEENADVGG